MKRQLNPSRTKKYKGEKTTTKKPQQTKNQDIVYPQYNKKGIINIPNTILQIFNSNNKKTSSPLETQVDPKNINKVVLLVVDGFGYHQFLKHNKQNKLLTNLTTEGKVFPLTSVFPSQTTNALTTLSTGLTPQEHGLFEYFIYMKNAGVINALKFERAHSKEKNKTLEVDPGNLFRGKTIANTLKNTGIDCFTHMNITNAGNACSKLIFEGSTIIPSLKPSDLIVNLRKNIEKTSGNAYFFVHLDSLDTISHEYGPQSHEYQAELSTITYLIQKELIEKVNSETAKETLILITSDHGAVDVNPEETIYIKLDLKNTLNLEVEDTKKPVSPIGSPRDIFLHIKKEKLNWTKEILKQKIGEKAEIIDTEEADKKGLFGLKESSQEFLERTGNLLIIPKEKQTVWFETKNKSRISFLGQHGGLNSEEMLVPFAIAKLIDLKK